MTNFALPGNIVCKSVGPVVVGPTGSNLTISPGATGRSLVFGDAALGVGSPFNINLSAAGNPGDGTTGHTVVANNILQTQFLTTPGTTFTLSGSAMCSPVKLSTNYTGTSSTSLGYAYRFTVAADTLTRSGGSGGFGCVGIDHNFGGAGATGGRIALKASITQTGAVATGSDIIGGAFWLSLTDTMGGTSGATRGNLYGLYPQIIMTNAATNYTVVNVWGEGDLQIAAGAAPVSVLGRSTILLSAHVAPGSLENIADLIGAQNGAVPTWENGYTFGGRTGPWPMSATSTLFGTTVQQVIGGTDKSGKIYAQTVAYGIDLSNVLFTSAALYSPGFSIDGHGKTTIANAQIGTTATGISIDIPNQIVTAITISTSGIGSGNGINNYYPGDIVRGPSGGMYQVATTKVRAATITSGGSGGTNGSQTVTGTTGTGTKFQATVTIAGGAITSINSISVAGAYTVNPTTPPAEPVTGAGLLGATLSLGIGIATLAIVAPDTAVSGSGTYANPVALANGSGAGATATLTWAANNTLSLLPSGGAIQAGSGAWSPNSNIATGLTAVGPTGSHTTVQEWFTVTNAAGVVRYIPAF